MNTTVVVVGVSVVIVLAIAGTCVVLRRKVARRRRDETPQSRYRSMVADLGSKPQNWKDKRQARIRKQRRKVWAAGAGAGVVGFYGSGAGGNDIGSGSGCGGAGGGCGGAGGCGGGS